MKPFATITVDSSEVLTTLDKLLKKHTETGKYPFIIGDDNDLECFMEMIEPPADGGVETLAKAQQVDVAEWFMVNGFKKPKTLAKGIQAQTGWVTLTDLLTGELKPKIHLGLIQVEKPHHIFAKLGFGGWNDCPEPHIHVALHHYWHEKFGAIPVVVSSDVVECFVPNPPTDDTAAALVLAGEQYVYCYDIVEQGFGSKPKLASSLVGAKVWYFWWD